MQDWVKYGGITGVIISLFWVTIALVAPYFLFNAWMGWIPVLVTGVGMVFYDRSLVYHQGLVEFKTIASLGFKFYFTAMGIYYFVDYLMYQGWVDELGQIRLDISLQRIDANEHLLGKENASIMKQELLEGGTAYAFTSFLFNFARSLIGGFLLAAIAGQIFTRNAKV